jgi:hypothetical protein
LLEIIIHDPDIIVVLFSELLHSSREAYLELLWSLCATIVETSLHLLDRWREEKYSHDLISISLDNRLQILCPLGIDDIYRRLALTRDPIELTAR